MLKQAMPGRRLAFLFFFVILILLTGCGGGLPSASWFGLAASDDTVYLAAKEQVFALDLESGVELWTFPAEPDKEFGPFYAAPLLRNDAIIVGGYGDGTLYAISRELGMHEWSVETEATIVEGAVSTDGGIVVGNDAGEVFLVEEETQQKRLLLKTDEPIWATPLIDEFNGRVYVASMDHYLYALDIASGEKMWAFEAVGALAGTPALSNGVIYFGALDSTFYAVDAETGEEKWQFETDGWVWGGPLVYQDTVIFGDMAGKVYALETNNNGSQRWVFEAEGGVRVTPLLVDGSSEQNASGLLYFGTRKGNVYAISVEDGTQKWAQSLNGAVYSQPVMSGDYLLVSPHNAKEKLVALDPEGLAMRWSYPPREE